VKPSQGDKETKLENQKHGDEKPQTKKRRAQARKEVKKRDFWFFFEGESNVTTKRNEKVSKGPKKNDWVK